ncbi:hypothetical protein [Chitinilyticum piscinae]|uniref:Transcription factor zinc-finger domain-containing protein n=1 Tax=Chitinilyticum piscinae TaxID=2866724 RepID=A0A8J7FJX9_9NEIS|nr:hypothetical protein [Chitinilyticum piscinae]MBE9609272.1 hypothetical protein [Chitinilyticum piscinae]
MNCTGCGAPLATDQLVCPFCGLHNAVDLLAIRDFRLLAEHSELQCPNGCGDLQRLQLGAGLEVTVGFCPQCKGLQFAPGAAVIALEKVAGQVREVNHDRISAILAERVPRETVRYRPCPACRVMMNRRAFNAHIPLIIDECREHGTWLDGGEFTVLAEWMEAGGAQMARQQAERNARLERVVGKVHSPVVIDPANAAPFTRSPPRPLLPPVLGTALLGTAWYAVASGNALLLLLMVLVAVLWWRWFR